MSIGSLSLQRTTSGTARPPKGAGRVAFGGLLDSGTRNGAVGHEAMHTEAQTSELPVNMRRPPKELPDHELLQRFTQGEEEAYVELYLRHQAEVYTYCLRLAAGDRDFASDLFQETFIKVYRKAQTFHEGTNVLGWLYTIVKTTYLNHKRKRQLVPLDDTHDNIQSGDRSLNPEYREEQATLKERVENAITSLPVEIREPFVLREFDGFSYQEISEQLNITLGAVRQRIYRAKLAMRESLWDLVHEEGHPSKDDPTVTRSSTNGRSSRTATSKIIEQNDADDEKQLSA